MKHDKAAPFITGLLQLAQLGFAESLGPIRAGHADFQDGFGFPSFGFPFPPNAESMVPSQNRRSAERRSNGQPHSRWPHTHARREPTKLPEDPTYVAVEQLRRLLTPLPYPLRKLTPQMLRHILLPVPRRHTSLEEVFCVSVCQW